MIEHRFYGSKLGTFRRSRLGVRGRSPYEANIWVITPGHRVETAIHCPIPVEHVSVSASGLIYAATQFGTRVFCYDLDGKQKWEHQFTNGAEIHSLCENSTNGVAVGMFAALFDSRNGVYALDEDGSDAWFISSIDITGSTSSVANAPRPLKRLGTELCFRMGNFGCGRISSSGDDPVFDQNYHGSVAISHEGDDVLVGNSTTRSNIYEATTVAWIGGQSGLVVLLTTIFPNPDSESISHVVLGDGGVFPDDRIAQLGGDWIVSGNELIWRISPSGALQWEVAAPGLPEGVAIWDNFLKPGDGGLYCGFERSGSLPTVRRFSSSTGELEWSYNTNSLIRNVEFHDDLLIVGGGTSSNWSWNAS